MSDPQYEQRARPNPRLSQQPQHVPLPPTVPYRDFQHAFNRPQPTFNPTVINNQYAAEIEKGLHRRNLERDQFAYAASPAGKRQTGPSNEDLFNAAGKAYDAENAYAEPIYRLTRMTANIRYALNATIEPSLQTLEFPIARDQMDGNQPMLLMNEKSLQDIVALKLEPFMLPRSMLQAGEISLGRLMVRFPMFSGPALGLYNYYGPPHRSSAVHYHFECIIEALDNSRVTITPLDKYHVFAYPARLDQNVWQMQVITPVRPVVQFPSPYITAVVAAAANPLIVTAVAHNLITGDFVTIDTESPSINYDPYNHLYAVTVVDPDTLSIAANGVGLNIAQAITLSPSSRAVRFNVKIISLDKKADITTGNRLVGGFIN